jgi:hypothetical protein
MSGKFQGQHRVPQIYLKQFGYVEDDKAWISVWYKGDNSTKNVLIENFSKETNIFDLPYGDPEFKRHFENESGKKIEDRYRTVINTLTHQKTLPERTRRILCNIVANFICRALPHRELFKGMLKHERGRDKFIKEVFLLDEENLVGMYEVLRLTNKDDHLNILSDYIIVHLVKVLWTFNCIILKDFGNRGWATCDNPVIIDKQNNHNWIMPIDAEVYLPLSKDYLLFMYHPEAEIQNNPLRLLVKNHIYICEENIHKNIWDKIHQNDSRYLIFPTKLQETKLGD